MCAKQMMAELVRKVWTQTKILSPNILLNFVAILRFVAIQALFGNLWAKKGPKCCQLLPPCMSYYF